jgi:hypothetical protein
MIMKFIFVCNTNIKTVFLSRQKLALLQHLLISILRWPSEMTLGDPFFQTVLYEKIINGLS